MIMATGTESKNMFGIILKLSSVTVYVHTVRASSILKFAGLYPESSSPILKVGRGPIDTFWEL